MPPQQKPPSIHSAARYFSLAAGAFFFVAIIKFGDPVIMDHSTKAPSGALGLLFESWPSRWGLWLVLPLLFMALWVEPWKRLRGGWTIALPAVWLGWELLAGTQTVGPALTSITLQHFAICVILFYLGCFGLDRGAPTWPVWTGMALAMCWVIRAGFEQHFGGLEATRKLIYSGQLVPDLPRDVLKDPEFIKRMARDRIFSTFWNANAFAGSILLLLPLSLTFLWWLTPKVRHSVRVGFVVVLGGCGMAALFWTGSKAGWLVALAIGLIALGHSHLRTKWKYWLIGSVLVVGMLGFGFKYASFFHQERNSVGARFGYWRAAAIVIRAHPLFGTGPGTFQIPFERIKRPTDEMARLVHNDYLEQGSDSGILGMICYSGMTIWFLYYLYRYRLKRGLFTWPKFAVWLGILGVCLQSTVDCHLYVPALAWPMFFLFGWLMSM